MAINWSTGEQRHRSLSLMAVVGLHALIAAAWLADRPVAPLDRTRVRWLRLVPLGAQQRASSPERQAQRTNERAGKPRKTPSVNVSGLVRSHASASIPAGSIRPAAPDLTSSNAVESQPPVAEATPSSPTGLQSSDLLTSARQMAGSIDRQLRRESGKQLPALSASPDARFAASLEAATARKWTGIAKVTETTMPGTGERLYKISNGTDTYCVRIPSPSVGIDRYEWERNNFHPITCPR